MQLKRRPKKIHKKIRSSLALATTTLLTGTSCVISAESIEGIWDIDYSILYYSEIDRVTAVEPVISARKTTGEKSRGIRFVVDVLTGSSANGAIVQSTPQTFTSASSGTSYTTPANEIPLDPRFEDTRIALSLDWESPMGERSKKDYLFNISYETDYLSLGTGAVFSWDSEQRLRTWTTGISFNLDRVNPVGGIPIGLTDTSVPRGGGGGEDEDEDDGDDLEFGNKKVLDLFFGVTQVISRYTLMQFNFNLGADQGYLTDPYKLLSQLDANGDLSATVPYLHEKRPDSKQRQAVFWKTVHSFGEDVLHFSYRYYWDDWGISSQTINTRYRFELGRGHYLQPHYRYYLQNKADFYFYNLVEGNTPSFASADYRVADMSSQTIGLKYGVEFDNNSEFTFRAETLTQKSENSNAPFGEVKAIILQMSYSLVF